MKKSADRKKISFNKIVIGLLAVGFFIYAAYSFILVQHEMTMKKQELDTLNAQYEEQRLYNENLKNISRADNLRLYIEEMAREKLGYAYADEVFFVDINGK